MDVTETSKIIKPINTDTVHKICSGQVVLNLAIAVKELVENSLDAGATAIEIRFKNYGVELIEVSDNGTGVTEDNFAALTLKYHTSKLNEYSDLLGVTSFGFRGEALSSLCLLADLTITTRHQSSDFATKIDYDHKGNITKKVLCSRQVGTTVTLSNLFSSLPVRQKDFHKNVKREFNKMTQLLYAYCLISQGVKITCTNQTNSNSKTLVVATQGISYKDNISCVFGSKQLNTILELKPEFVQNIKENILKGLSNEVQAVPDDITVDDVEIDLSEDSNEAESTKESQELASSQSSNKSRGHKNQRCPLEFTGYISSCAHGCGRSSADRQFYFVNSRPCEPVKVMKIVNEIYRQYNPNQYPFVFLNVNLDTSSVDINVTPDKRKVFLTKEKIILDVIKCSMLKLYESIPRTLKIETGPVLSQSQEDTKPSLDQPRVFNAFLEKFANKTFKADKKPETNLPHKNTKFDNNELKRKSTSMLDYVSKKAMRVEEVQEEQDSLGVATIHEKEIINYTTELNNYENRSIERTKLIDDDIISNKNEVEPKKEILFLEATDAIPDTQIRSIDEIEQSKHTIYCKTNRKADNLSPMRNREIVSEHKKIVTDKEIIGKHNKRSIVIKTSIEHVKALSEIYKKRKSKSEPERVKFRSGINPVFNKKCEEELSKEISKDSFKQMEVIGQFNLGFIITQLEDDLFIIDQHATDEIYNFETLQKTTELTSQKLVIPQQLELTGVNEQILMDNLEVFKRNGFTFAIDENALPTKRVKLLTLPMSKNWIFGKEDIEELLFMLRESPSEYCRPSRVRAMFASRACRKSVMIGTSLSKADMKRLVDHMAEIEKPWNCPHGRPTIRHLVNLAMVYTEGN